MISYADLEFAITHWKARAAGIPQPGAPVTSGAVKAEVPVANAPEQAEASPEAAEFETP
jgi:hypothetical protein